MITQVSLKESKECVPDFRRANFQALRCYFSAIEWREVLNGKNVEDQWLCFSQLLCDACAKFIPSRKRRKINRPQWLSGIVKNALNKKTKLWKKYKKSKDKKHLDDLDG